MIALLGTVFLASLVGSLHCAGMCGGIALVCSSGDPRSAPGCGAAKANETSRGVLLLPALAYHGGRLMAYGSAGALAGALGAALDLGGRLAGVQALVGVIAGIAVVLAGVALLLRQGGFGATARVPGALQRGLNALYCIASRASPTPRALLIGAGSVLLPCGWLWAFLAVAAGAANPLGGAAIMVVFWTGTVPVLAVIGVGFNSVRGLWRGRLTTLAALAMITVGLHTALVSPSRSASLSRAGVRPATDLVSASARLEESRSEVPACCRTNDDIDSGEGKQP